jgi:ABC-type Na+ efflux pump, permease component
MSLQKIWLILSSEFWRRVRSRAFILATLLVPIGLLALLTLPSLITVFASETTQRTVVVRDASGQLGEPLREELGDNYTVTLSDAPVDSLQAATRRGEYDAALVLPESLLRGEAEATLYSKESGSFLSNVELDGILDNVVRDVRLRRADAGDDVMQIVESDVAFSTATLTEQGAEGGNTFIFTALAYGVALIIYMAVFIYGQYVMQGVIEEKSNRVVEVVVSSVRPFQLMMGKVLGIGAMGLVQIMLWSTLAFAGLTSAGTIAALFFDPSSFNLSESASQAEIAEAAGLAFPEIPVSLFAWFILFFVGGYLLYASVFAAVGSAVEQQQDAQSLLFVVLIPLLIPLMMMGVLLEAPNSTLSVVLSLIPLFTPILMPMRVALVDVPIWELGLSVALLVLAFMGTIWLAGRIYRVGILSYGKTPGFRELAKWVTYE